MNTAQPFRRPWQYIVCSYRPRFQCWLYPLSQSELYWGVCMTAGNGLWYHRLTVHLFSESRHHWNPNVKEIYYSCWDKWCCFSHLSSSYMLFLFPFTEVKGRRTGRSRYLCGTRSAVTGWETTSTSTCTSAPHRVGMGGSTRHTKSPVTVRHRPLYFWFAHPVEVIVLLFSWMVHNIVSFLASVDQLNSLGVGVYEWRCRLQVSRSALWI